MRPLSAMRPLSVAGLAYLHGQDADARLSALVSQRSRVRPALGEFAISLVDRKRFEALGFRCLGDWSRERIGVEARTVREWGRVWRALLELPDLRAAVLSREVSWTVARKIVAHVTPENQAACVETVRAVEELLRAAFPNSGAESSDEPVSVRIPCSARVEAKWVAAQEIARRVAGENLPVWECAEAVAAECLSAAAQDVDVNLMPARSSRRAASKPQDEQGLRALAWPHLRCRLRGAATGNPLASLARGLDRCSPLELDRRFRVAIAIQQELDFEIGRILRQVVDRKLYLDLGLESFERYVEEGLDLSPRTARRLVRLARAERRAPEVAIAFREGRITLLKAEVLLRGGSVELAEKVMLRRLEEEVPQRKVEFRAPREVAELFLGLVARFGLEAMLDHALRTWLEAGRQFVDYADFERDGWRCTVPGCSARRNLQSHHIVFRSRGGRDLAWNRTTLCAWHHQRGVHEGRIGIRGRAPDRLVYSLGIGRYRSGDVLLSSA